MDDFAIAVRRGEGRPAWDVVHLGGADEGREVAARVASFGERAHAEAFLRDLLLALDNLPPAPA